MTCIFPALVIGCLLSKSAAAESQIAIQTYDGHYLTAVDGGGKAADVIHSDATVIRTFERFKLIDLGGGDVAIQTDDGHYLNAIGGRTANAIRSDATLIRTFERFKLIDVGGGDVAIQTHDGFYLTALDGGGKRADVIVSNRTTIREWESFRIVDATHSVGSCLPNINQIALFRHVSFRGDCTVLDAGEYPDAAAMSIGNDTVSSIRIGENAIASLCQHNNLAGECETFVSDDANLSNNKVGNDSVSSARVSTSGNNFNHIVARHSGKCLTAWGKSVSQNQCAENRVNDFWKLIPVVDTVDAFVRHEQTPLHRAAPYNGNHYMLESVNRPGTCLSVAKNNEITLTSCDENTDAITRDQRNAPLQTNSLVQSWRIEPIRDNYYQIVSWSTNKCLDVAGGDIGDGVLVQQHKCHQQNNQLWRILIQGEQWRKPLYSDVTYWSDERRISDRKWIGPSPATWKRLGCAVESINDHDRDFIPDAHEDCVAKHYAPMILLHEREGKKGWPSSAEWFWRNSVNAVTNGLLVRHPEDFVLFGMSQLNYQEEPPVYTHVYPNVLGGISIQYWYFFPYNGTRAWHYGDWEHVTLRLDSNLELDGIAYYHHGKRTWKNRPFVHIYEDYYGQHPFVYIAEQSHASYATDYECDNGGYSLEPFIPRQDECRGERSLWWLPYVERRTVPLGNLVFGRYISNNFPLVTFGEIYIGVGLTKLGERRFENHEWERFEGRWGSRWIEKILGKSTNSSSPEGPLFKRDTEWLEDAAPF